MAAEMVTPVDEFTGMPLPLAPDIELLQAASPDELNWHHSLHPSNDPLFKTLAGWAFRNARLQLVHESQHNNGPESYHSYYKGPDNLPHDETEIIRRIILAVAGCLPESRKAIEVSGGRPREVDLSDAQIKVLRVFGEAGPVSDRHVALYRKRYKMMELPFEEVRRIIDERKQRQAQLSYRYLTYRYDPIRDFFSEHVLSQDINAVVDRKTLNKFLTGAEESRRQAGHNIIAKIVERAVVPPVARINYRSAWEKDLLHPAMPPKPETLVKHKLGSINRREELFPRMLAKLTGVPQPKLVAA